MTKAILISGSTDGIGLLTAKALTSEGHTVLLHGRNSTKLEAALAEVDGSKEGYVADLSDMNSVRVLADEILQKHNRLDVLINNAGVYKTPNPTTSTGMDTRFAVNTLAPFLLTKLLLPILPKDGRVINLSSAAQAPVDVDALAGKTRLYDMGAYAQSKLAITIWSQELAKDLPDGPAMIAVNPGSLLASKMVKEGFGVAGYDLSIGADILCRAALSEEFSDVSGSYYDNDSKRFTKPHAAASDQTYVALVMASIERLYEHF